MSNRFTVRRTAPVALSVVLLSGALAAGQVAARDADIAGPGSLASGAADLRAALDTDGRFVGASGLVGTVDLGRWMLVSDPTTGEAPRFADARKARRDRPAGPSSWASVGSGPLNEAVLALRAQRTELYLGGEFFSPPGAADADGIAAWDGSAYSAFGPNNSIPSTVNAIAVDGEDLYVGGSFTNPSFDATADRIAKWDGGTGRWESIGGGLNAQVNAIAIDGSDIYVGGDFVNADSDNRIDYIARYDGSWNRLDQVGNDGSLNGHVNAIAVSGGDIFVGGLFDNADTLPKADYVARWDGAWHAMGNIGNEGALDDEVHALLVSGLDLYVGGSFHDADAIADADLLAKWRNGTWSAVGTNFAGSDGGDLERVYALAMAGRDLYVGGHFVDAADIDEADRVARFDGNDWSALGQTAPGNGAIDDTVYALAVFDRELYVGGVFEDAAGDLDADYLARWTLPTAFVPDGRVRIGLTGPFTGNDIYNSGGKNQKLTVREPGGTWITFQVSIQNDSATSDDTFKVEATGAANSDFIFKVLSGGVVITPAVLGAGHHTLTTAPGNARTIKIRIKVKVSASAGETYTQTIRITSDGNPSKVDVVKVVASSDN